MSKKILNIIDIFSGCGGLTLGFNDAGFKDLIAVDNDSASLETFKYNFPNTVTLNLDLFQNKSISQITKKAKSLTDNSIDVIVGGPPCQGFSLTGPRNFNDPRNRLYLSFIDLVIALRPSAFLIENVPGVKNLYGGRIYREIEKRFIELGYNISSDILNSADYGVPQIRKRLFIIGLKKEIGIYEFPDRTHSPKKYLSCKDAIHDLPKRDPRKDVGSHESTYNGPPATAYQKKMRGNSKVLWNHVATVHKNFVIETIAQVPDGGNWRDLPPGVGESRRFNEAWTRYNSKLPSRTIDTGHRNHFHYLYNRVPTIRENARLQSFPDSFRFMGNKSQQNRQVGNAVPPLLAYNLAKQLKKLLNK